MNIYIYIERESSVYRHVQERSLHNPHVLHTYLHVRRFNSNRRDGGDLKSGGRKIHVTDTLGSGGPGFSFHSSGLRRTGRRNYYTEKVQVRSVFGSQQEKLMKPEF